MIRNKLADIKIWGIGVFLLTSIYFYAFGSALIQYENDQFLFLYTLRYFSSFTNMPGELMYWLTAFFTQFYYYTLLGAIVIGITMASLFCLMAKILKDKNFPFYIAISLAITFNLIIVVQHYESSLLPVLAIITNLVVSSIYLLLKRASIRLIASVVAVTSMYYLTGGFFYLFFFMVVVSELFHFKGMIRFVNALFFSIVTLFIPYVLALNKYYIFFKDAYFYPLITKEQDYSNTLIFIIVGMLVALLANKLANFKLLYFLKNKRLHLYLSLFALLIGFGFLYQSYNRNVEDILKISQLGKNAQWDEVLEYSRNCSINNFLIPYFTNLSLANKGTLLDSMFYYPQKGGVNGLLFPWDQNRHLKEHGGVVFYELGYVNEAHHLAFECLVENGCVAGHLCDLVKYNLVLNKPLVAHKYINILKESFFWRGWALEMEKYCTDECLLNNEQWIIKKRNQIPVGDYFMDLKGIERDLIELVENTEVNKMAIDYLAAYYLLSHQIEKLVQILPKINEFYIEYPLHIKQALKMIGLEDTKDKSMIEEYRKYTDFKRQGNKQALLHSYSTSYWYFVDFVYPQLDNKGLK